MIYWLVWVTIVNLHRAYANLTSVSKYSEAVNSWNRPSIDSNRFWKISNLLEFRWFFYAPPNILNSRHKVSKRVIAACSQLHRYGNSHVIRDHTVRPTCHPAEVTFPPLPQQSWYLIFATPEGCKAELAAWLWLWSTQLHIYRPNTAM